MKRIYILPYSNKTFFSYKKRVSGIDSAALTQFRVLKELGYDVRMFMAQGDLHKHIDGIDYFTEEPTQGMSSKEYEKANRSKILEKLLQSIVDHKPDVILSNFEFNSFYEKIMNLNIPVVYNSHSMPGFWVDLNNANLLHSFTSSGHSFCCVSEFHKEQTIKYYRNKRKDWVFDEIIPDCILFPQYCDKEKVEESSGFVKHVSVASKKKDTFLIHKFLEDTDIPTEVFTTLVYVGSKEEDPYITESIEKYKHYPRSTRLDIDHDDIMDEIGEAGAVFVGNVPDTFTITSLEALSRGVPLLVKGYQGKHPSLEMIGEDCSKYIYIYKNKIDFIEKVKEFIMLPISEREKIARSTYNMMSKEKYKTRITSVLESAISKYNKNNNNGVGSLWDEFS